MSLSKFAAIYKTASDDAAAKELLEELIELNPEEIFKKLKSIEIVPVLEFLEYLYRLAKANDKGEEVKEILGDYIAVRNPLDGEFWENIGQKLKTTFQILKFV
jgi:hypothetical protein